MSDIFGTQEEGSFGATEEPLQQSNGKHQFPFLSFGVSDEAPASDGAGAALSAGIIVETDIPLTTAHSLFCASINCKDESYGYSVSSVLVYEQLFVSMPISSPTKFHLPLRALLYKNVFGAPLKVGFLT